MKTVLEKWKGSIGETVVVAAAVATSAAAAVTTAVTAVVVVVVVIAVHTESRLCERINQRRFWQIYGRDKVNRNRSFLYAREI